MRDDNATDDTMTEAGADGSGDRRGYSPLVVLKRGDLRTPIFLVHGLGGEVDELRIMARQIETERAVLGVRAFGINEDEQPLSCVAQTAQLYIKVIRALQPEGPYFLSGFSYGGIIALEMAQILRAEGIDVAMLFLIDAYPHPRTWPMPERLGFRARVLRNRVRLALMRGVGGTARVIAERLAEKRKKPEPSAAQHVPARRWPGAPEPFLPLPLQRVHEAGTLALENYVPRPYPGKIQFMTSAEQELIHPRRPGAIFKKLATSFDVYVAPGRHLGLVKENAGVTAGCIGRRLASAELRS